MSETLVVDKLNRRGPYPCQAHTTAGRRINPQTPNFGPGPLPIDYIALSRSTVKSGMAFGPVSFTLSENSCRKQLGYWRRQNLPFFDLISDEGNSFPFLFWSLPRVLCRWYGRLNEVIAVCSDWRVVSDLDSSGRLVGHVTVLETFSKAGLEFATFESTTTNSQGRLMLQARDTWLLANRSDVAVLRRLGRHGHWQCLDSMLRDHQTAGEWYLTTRYIWQSAEWRNNVHITEYAKRLGYPGALIEGPLVADLLYVWRITSTGKRPDCLRWRYLRPLGEGTRCLVLPSISHPNELALAELNWEARTGAILVQALVEG